MKKARSLLERYKEHQEKLRENPDSLARAHWHKEKQNFYGRIVFYYTRAGIDMNGVI